MNEGGRRVVPEGDEPDVVDSIRGRRVSYVECQTSCHAGAVGPPGVTQKRVTVAPSDSSTFSSKPGGVRVPLRISMAAGGRGPVDGAWWPQSRDLDFEAAELIDAFPAALGRVSRMLFSPPDWARPGSTRQRRVQARERVVKVGSFPRDDTHLMIVTVSGAARIHLLVIPPDCRADVAARAMAWATDPANTHSAAEILRRSHLSVPPPPPRK